MLSSMVRLLTITAPVPPGVRRMSALELEDIILSLKLRLSTVTPPLVNVIAPVTVNAPSVDSPLTFNVPVVVRFSLPKLIAPDESVIDPSASVRLPNVEPDAAVIVPVVVRFSLPKLMAPDESVIEPLASVRLPIVVPDPAEMAPENVVAPDTANVPSTISPSLMFMLVESVELNVVPAICMPPNTTDPGPDVTTFMSSVDLVPSLLFPLLLNPRNSSDPDPARMTITS